MRRLILLCACLCAVAFAVAAGPAQATNPRSWVSNSGMDSNTCTLAFPCATFARAIMETTAGGEVDCLTPGDFGSGFSITSSLTIDCGAGQVGAITGGGISIAAGPTGVVIVRNLTINGFANAFPGTIGILVTSVGKLVIEHCNIIGFPASPGLGIEFAPSNSALLRVSDSTIDNNGTAGSGGGILVQPSAGVTAGVVIERTQLTGNTYGIAAGGASGTSLVEVRYSTIANSVFDGIVANTTGPVVSIVVEHSASVRNGGNGINAQGTNAYVSLNDSVVDWNATGLTTSSGGVILSTQNNFIAGNLSPGVTPLNFGLK
jgi:hypothetical protein